MGEGLIISYIGFGQYQVQPTLERARITVALSMLTAQIAAMETRIAGMADGQEKDIATLQKTSMEKREEMLENAPADTAISAWCADMTDDLSGIVGTIEIPGERGVVQIQPGYDRNAVYGAARDGQLQSAIASTPTGVFYNWAMLPGWQKWKPTFRVGVLSALDSVNNLCTVTLDGAESSAQDLDINQGVTLLSVPVEYMDCNAMAFKNNDRVLVKFDNQNWNTPKVVGFETNPRRCNDLVLIYGSPEEYLDFSYIAESPVFVPESVTCTDGGTGTITNVIGTTLYGWFIKCWSGTLTGSTSGATATVNSAIEEHYQRKYDYKTIFAASVAAGTEEIVFTSPLEQPPTSDISAQATQPSRQAWTKTIDDLCLSAFIHYPLGRGFLGAARWAVSATIKGEVVSWIRNSTYFPYAETYHRQVCKSGTCLFADEWMNVHIGFDCWTEINGETSETEYYVALMSDVWQRFTLFKYNPTTNKMDLIESKNSRVRDIYFDPASNPERHVRLIGFGREAKDKYYAYWCYIGSCGDYYKEEVLTADVEHIVEIADGVIVTAIWQPVERQLYFITQDDPVTGDMQISESSHQDGSCTCYGYYDYWDCSICGSFSYQPTDFSGNVSVAAAECDVLQGFDVWSSVSTIAERESNAVTEYNDFKVGSDDYPGGSQNVKVNRSRQIGSRKYGGYCSTGIVSSDEGFGYATHVTPTNRKDYEFLGGVISPGGGIAYKYQSVGYEQKNLCNPEHSGSTNTFRKCKDNITQGSCPTDCRAYSYELTYRDCWCEEYDWESHESGGDETVAISLNFPYDQNWRAILLQGEGKSSAVHDDPLTEHEGLIVYENADTGNLFMMDEAVKTDIGIYSRTFFQQF